MDVTGSATSAGPQTGADAERDALIRTINRVNGALVTAQASLKSLGRPDSAELAWRQASRRTLSRIVVVGETKRGKSSLVNALAGAGELSPVGAEETTATYVSLIPDPEATEVTRAEALLADGTRLPLAVADIARHADLSQPGQAGVPVGVDVYVPPGPLGSVVLTDTPGVGSLRGSQAEVTRRTAADGGALLFVVDAGSPMSQPELEFLTECAASVEFVVVAVTMIDKYPQSAAEMVEHVHRQLARHSTRAGRYPVVGVSAPAALKAQSMPPGDLRDRLLSFSGIPALVERLSVVAAQRRVMGSVNGLRTCRSAVDSLLAEAALSRRSAAPDAASAPDLLRRQAELKELQGTKARWRLDLDRDTQRLRSDLVRGIADRLDELSESWRVQVEKSPLLGGMDFRRRLCLQMAADYQLLRQDLATQLITRLTTMLTDLFAPEPVPPAVTAMLDGGSTRQHKDITLNRTKTGLGDPGVLISGAMGGRLAWAGASHLAGAGVAGLSMPMLAPLVVVGAAGWLAFNWLFRNQRVDRQTLLSELNRNLGAERAGLVEQLDGQLREVRPEIIVFFEEHLVEQQRRIQLALNQLKVAQTASAEEQRAGVAVVDAKIAELTTLGRQIDDAISLATRVRPGTK